MTDPAEELRAAAKAVREDAAWPTEEFSHAVADWLDAAASCSCGPFDDHGDLAAAALAVARAYRGNTDA